MHDYKVADCLFQSASLDVLGKVADPSHFRVPRFLTGPLDKRGRTHGGQDGAILERDRRWNFA